MTVPISIALGVKQGCPTSGFLWALAFDHLVWAASYCALRSEGSLGAFAGDLSAAFRDLVVGLQALVPTLLRMRRAAGLRLNLDKTNVVNFRRLSTSDLEIALRVALGIASLRVRSEATSLGFIISARVSEKS